MPILVMVTMILETLYLKHGRDRNVNKSELVDAIASKTKQPKSTVNAMIDAFTATVTATLKKGQKVSLVGFGTFESRRRAATTGRNPRTGATIKIPASNQPKFKPGKALKDALN